MKHWSDFFNSYKQQLKFAQDTLKIDYEPEEMCVNCVVNHMLVKNQTFGVKCKPVHKGFFNIPLTNKNAAELLKKSPYHFSKYVLKIQPREFQKEIIGCTATRKVLRISRRAGKTHALAMYSIWYQSTNPRQKIRIVAPREAHIREFFDQLETIIRAQPQVLEQIVKQGRTHTLYSKNPYELRFSNQATIRGTTTGDSDGVSVRSQSADLLILDETDYISEEAFAAVYPLVATNSNTKLLQASTPSGRRTYFYSWCNDPGFKEFHRRYQDVKEVYDPDQDIEFQRTLDKEKYQREVLAEFTVQEDAVFKNELIDKQLQDYEFDTFPPPPGVYTIGVDWNESVQGVHIVVQRHESFHDKTRISNVVIVPPSEFTQLVQIQRIIELIEQYNPKMVLLDEGFGVTQAQALKQWANNNAPEYIDKIQSLSFSSAISTFDPITGTYTKVPAKMFIVQLTTRMLENERLILPRNLDTKYKLIGQMRQYQVEKVLENGQIKYTKGNVHTLEAMFLALYGLYLVKDEIRKVGTAQPIVYKRQSVSQVRQHVRTNAARMSIDQWSKVYPSRRRW